MLKKKWLWGTLITTAVITSACGGGDDESGDNGEAGGEEQEHNIRVANYFAQDHPQNVALEERFKQLVEENSGGSLSVEIYPDSQLGAEEEFYEGVRSGTIEMEYQV
ncbi:hypothetical protein [Sinobaca sp. H24]|uniref:hypothetical protein n=1 Tax=Sinobaca sp. H24 TaxID=2923376 RepID=UPI00207ADD6D|nr:hypothetical protein [Sinobaca sp. H24]